MDLNQGTPSPNPCRVRRLDWLDASLDLRYDTPVDPEMKFACQNCNQRLEADPGQSGLTLNCPVCGCEIVVPGTVYNYWAFLSYSHQTISQFVRMGLAVGSVGRVDPQGVGDLSGSKGVFWGERRKRVSRCRDDSFRSFRMKRSYGQWKSREFDSPGAGPVAVSDRDLFASIGGVAVCQRGGPLF